MINVDDYKVGKSCWAVSESIVYKGTMADSSKDWRDGGFVHLSDITSEEEIPVTSLLIFSSKEVFLTEDEAYEEGVRQCDEIMTKLKDKKDTVIKELREGRRRQKKIAKEFIEIRKNMVKIRNGIRKELPNLNI